MATRKAETTTVEKPKKVTTRRMPTQDEIRKKAEEIYFDRISRGISGTSVDDWLKAEKLLKSTRR